MPRAKRVKSSSHVTFSLQQPQASFSSNHRTEWYELIYSDSGQPCVELNRYTINIEPSLELSAFTTTLFDLPQDVLDILKTIVPFLAPPNLTWPDYIKNIGLNLGERIRSGNSSQNDFPLSDILDRVPYDCRAHIVLTNPLQSSYYQQKQQRKARLRKQAVVKTSK